MLEYILESVSQQSRDALGTLSCWGCQWNINVSEIWDDIFPIVHPIPTVLQTHRCEKAHTCRYMCAFIDVHTHTHKQIHTLATTVEQANKNLLPNFNDK